MELVEAWKTSQVSYTELVYRPMVRSGYTTRDMGSRKSVQRALTGATLNKLIFAFFTMAGALFPFVLYRLRATTIHLTSASIDLTVAVSLSVLLVFGYLVLYCVQVLPSFVSSGSFAPLAQLPVTPREVSESCGNDAVENARLHTNRQPDHRARRDGLLHGLLLRHPARGARLSV